MQEKNNLKIKRVGRNKTDFETLQEESYQLENFKSFSLRSPCNCNYDTGNAYDIYVLYCDKKPIGYGVLSFYYTSPCNLDEIFISKKYRKKGFGNLLLQYLLKIAFEFHNQHKIELICYSINKNALKLYDKYMIVEGVRKKSMKIAKYGWIDKKAYAIFKDIYEEKLKKDICNSLKRNNLFNEKCP